MQRSPDICNWFRSCSGSRRTVLFRLSDTDTVYGCNAWYQGVHSRCIRRDRFHSGSIDRGILLGVIEILGRAYISSQLSDAIVFAVLIIVLLVKPSGILGKQVHEKV